MANRARAIDYSELCSSSTVATSNVTGKGEIMDAASLYIAATPGHIDLVQFLVERDAKIDAVTAESATSIPKIP